MVRSEERWGDGATECLAHGRRVITEREAEGWGGEQGYFILSIGVCKWKCQRRRKTNESDRREAAGPGAEFLINRRFLEFFSPRVLMFFFGVVFCCSLVPCVSDFFCCFFLVVVKNLIMKSSESSGERNRLKIRRMNQCFSACHLKCLKGRFWVVRFTQPTEGDRKLV